MGWSLHNLISNVQGLGSQLGRGVDRIIPGNQQFLHPPQQPQQPQPQRPVQRGTSPTDLGRVWGTLVTQNAADKQQWTPMIRNIVQATNPVVQSKLTPGGNDIPRLQGPSDTSHIAQGGGAYWPDINRITLNSNQTDPYTVTHEGLHAAFERKTPQAQQGFQQLYDNKASTTNKRIVDDRLGNDLYGGQRPLTEVHSYAPQYKQFVDPALQKYYSHYFSNGQFGNNQGQSNLLGLLYDMYHRSANKFDDWRDQ